jgi:hypothetical protein
MSAKKKPTEELSEDAAWEIAIKDHPEWRQAWEDNTLPEEIVGEDGEPMNPRLHLTMHAVVERQLAADEPNGVVAVAKQLRELGLSRHEIRHEIARAVVDQMWDMLQEGCEFDEKRYLAELRQIVDSLR